MGRFRGPAMALGYTRVHTRAFTRRVPEKCIDRLCRCSAVLVVSLTNTDPPSYRSSGDGPKIGRIFSCWTELARRDETRLFSIENEDKTLALCLSP